MLTNDNYFSKATGIADQWRFDRRQREPRRDADVPHGRLGLGAGRACTKAATTVVLRDVDPAAILDAVARHRITNMLLVPAVIQMLLATPGVEARGLLERAGDRLRRLADHRRRAGEGPSSASVASSSRCTG